MLDLYDKIEEATAAIRRAWNRTPHAGIILGTGLGNLVERIEIEAALEYDSIPHFANSTSRRPSRADGLRPAPRASRGGDGGPVPHV